MGKIISMNTYKKKSLLKENWTRNGAKYQVINSVFKLKKLSEKMSSLEEFAFDTETNTLRVYADNEEFRLVGISISWGKYNNYYIPTGHLRDKNISIDYVIKYLKDIFENPNIRLVGWNIKFDMHVLARIGISINTLDIFDGMIASFLCDENSPNGLKQNSESILGADQSHFADVLTTITPEIKKQYGLKSNQKATFDLTLIKDGSPYAVDDAFFTWELYLYYLQRLEKEDMLKIYNKMYISFILVLFRMEERGITLDKEKLEQMDIDMTKDLEDLQYKIYECSGIVFNMSSSQQLAEIIFGYDKSKNPNKELLDKSFNFSYSDLGTTPKGVPQTNSDNLERLLNKEYKTKRKQEGQKMIKYILEYKKLNKLKTAFVTGLLELVYPDGKIHPSFNPIGATSGRISCSEPNLMQLPNAEDDDKYQIRDCFIGSVNEKTGIRNDIISIDYSNLEVRVMAHFSKDPHLIQAFLDGVDLHGNTAKMMFRLDCHPNEVKKLYPHLRQQAKVIAFLLQYGGTAPTLCSDLNKYGELDKIVLEQGKDKKSDFYGCKKPVEVAQKLMDMYFSAFPGIADFMKKQKKYAHRNGYVSTLVGRKRRLEGINDSSNWGNVAYLERLSINATIQGSGADIMINAQNRIEGIKPIKNTSEFIKEHNLPNDFVGSKRLKELGCEMLVQIHDELLFECPPENCEEAIAIIKDYMIHPFGEKVELNLPLDVGSGHGHSYQTGH